MRLFLALAFLCAAPASWAGLLGTSVTGSLQFGSATNYFDPANGFVPNGPLNKAGGTTVTIANPAVEFGFMDASNTDTADFTDTQLTYTDVAVSAGGGVAVTLKFTDNSFSTVSLASTNITGLTFGLVGNLLTVNVPAFSNPQTLNAVFNINTSAATPEPSSFGFAALGIASLLAAARRRR